MLTLNTFLFHIVYIEANREGTYIRPVISENGYLNIMTEEDKPKDYIKNKLNVNPNMDFEEENFYICRYNSEYLIMTFLWCL